MGSLNSIIKNYVQYDNTWDEMFNEEGHVRELYREFGNYLESVPIESLNKMQEFSKQFFMNQGVTFTVYNNKKGVERIFPFNFCASNIINFIFIACTIVYICP